MIDPTTTCPALVITIPEAELALSERHVPRSSAIAFENELARMLEVQLDQWVRVQVRGERHHQITAQTGRPIPLNSIRQVDEALEALLADPDRWRVWRHWHWDIICRDADHYDGTARWGAFEIPYDAITRSEPYVMYCGLQFEGEEQRSWYRCQLPRKWPIDSFGFDLVERALHRWLTQRWPEGPNGLVGRQG